MYQYPVPGCIGKSIHRTRKSAVVYQRQKGWIERGGGCHMQLEIIIYNNDNPKIAEGTQRAYWYAQRGLRRYFVG